MRWCPRCGREKELHDLNLKPLRFRACLVTQEDRPDAPYPVFRADDDEYDRRRKA